MEIENDGSKPFRVQAGLDPVQFWTVIGVLAGVGALLGTVAIVRAVKGR